VVLLPPDGLIVHSSAVMELFLYFISFSGQMLLFLNIISHMVVPAKTVVILCDVTDETELVFVVMRWYL